MCEDGIFVLGTTFKVSGELSFAIWDHLKTQRCKLYRRMCERKLDESLKATKLDVNLQMKQ